jgi:hypothetical protein
MANIIKGRYVVTKFLSGKVKILSMCNVEDEFREGIRESEKEKHLRACRILRERTGGALHVWCSVFSGRIEGACRLSVDSFKG